MIFALPLFQLLHDLFNDFCWPIADIDRDRMLIRRRLLQCCELAVEQRNRHEVPVPRRHTPMDQISRSVKVDQRHIRPVTDNNVAIDSF